MPVFEPFDDRIVIDPDTAAGVSDGGIYLPELVQRSPNTGTVVAVGIGRRSESGTLIPMDVNVGDRVIYGKLSASEVVIADQKYLILTRPNVWGRLHDVKVEDA